MKAPVPHLIYRPSRSVPATILALLLLIAGGLGAWLTGYRLITGSWPHRTVTTLDAVGAASLSSIAVLVAAGIAAVFGIFLVIAALWPGRRERVEVLPDAIPGQTAASRRDLATLVKTRVMQIGTIRSAVVTTHGSKIDVAVYSDVDDLETVREAASKKTDEALETFQPVGITHGRVRAKRVN
jgi:hypothetical protein avisC_11199